MSTRLRVAKAGWVGVCLLTPLLVRVAGQQPAAAPNDPERPVLGERPLRGPADGALRVARWWRMRAMADVSEQFDALEAWDPDATRSRDLTTWRRLMSRDPHGYLQRARAVATESLRLARTRSERYQARLLLGRLDCESGDHRGELEQARALMAMAPQSQLSLIAMRRAAECNGLEALAGRMDQALRTLPFTLRWCTDNNPWE
jgi:hypothetical protein